jgi:hypothetical protein
MAALRTGLARSGFKLPEGDDGFFEGRFPAESERGLAGAAR